MTTTTCSPGPAPASPALRVLRVLLVVGVVFAASLQTLALVATYPITALLPGLPLAFGAGFGTPFGVGRLGAAVAERT